MAKLHELLAVKDSLRGQMVATMAELKNTFEKKRHHFTAKTVRFLSTKEGVEPVTQEQLSIQTTVPKEIDWISEKISKSLNIENQISMANCQAFADVILEDGTTLLRNVPATTLLDLTKRMEELADFVKAIPTLDPALGFEADTSIGEGIFKARRRFATKTEKEFGFVVMVQPTDKHPAQVKELMLDKPIGSIETDEWSSMITIAEKGAILDRLEDITRAVKAARSRANEMHVQVTDNKIGDELLRYLFKGAL